MLAEIQNPCTPLLAHVLDLPWINHWPLAPIDVDFDHSHSRTVAHLMVRHVVQDTSSRVPRNTSLSGIHTMEACLHCSLPASQEPASMVPKEQLKSDE